MLHNVKIYAVDRAYDPDRIDPAYARAANRHRIKATMLSMASANQPGDRGWFVLQTIDRREKTVEESLSAKNILSYLPMIEGGKAVRRHRVVTLPERAAMPGYVLVNVVPSAAAFCVLRHFDGVIGIVGVAGQPHRVRDEIINRFKIKLGEYDPCAEHAERFKVGDWVRFDEGPFIGFSGRIVKLRKAVPMRGLKPIAIEGIVQVDTGDQSHTITTPLAFLVKP